jgi:hypothetical protein
MVTNQLILRVAVVILLLTTVLPVTRGARLDSQEAPGIVAESDPEPSARPPGFVNRVGPASRNPDAVGAYLHRPVFLDRIFVDRQFEAFGFADNDMKTTRRSFRPIRSPPATAG